MLGEGRNRDRVLVGGRNRARVLGEGRNRARVLVRGKEYLTDEGRGGGHTCPHFDLIISGYVELLRYAGWCGLFSWLLPLHMANTFLPFVTQAFHKVVSTLAYALKCTVSRDSPHPLHSLFATLTRLGP